MTRQQQHMLRGKHQTSMLICWSYGLTTEDGPSSTAESLKILAQIFASFAIHRGKSGAHRNAERITYVMRRGVPMIHYILTEHRQPVPVTVEVWAEWHKTFENCIVQKTQIAPGIEVSTVFLGLDHGPLYDRQGNRQAPILFETMIRGGPQDSWCIRTSTWEEAESAHTATVRRAQGDEHV